MPWPPEPQPPCTGPCCTGSDPCQSTTQTCTPEDRCGYCTIPAITHEWLLVRAHRIDTDCGPFAVADWDSRDLYRSLRIGTTYDLTVTGTRVDALDWHPTVTDAEPVDE